MFPTPSPELERVWQLIPNINFNTKTSEPFRESRVSLAESIDGEERVSVVLFLRDKWILIAVVDVCDVISGMGVFQD